MVKIKYVGSMATGFVKGIGAVKVGDVYEIGEKFAKQLVKNTDFKVVEDIKVIKEEKVFKKKKYENKEE